MSIWAIADLHLSFGVPDKTMDRFGEQWVDHARKVESHWREFIQPSDLVLLAGDFSWAMKPMEVIPDLNWLDSLPGEKLMIRGNHDYWWSSLKQLKEILPPSIQLIQNNAIAWKDVVVGGTRLWDTAEYHFDECIDYQNSQKDLEGHSNLSEDVKIFQRELGRLEMSLSCFKNFPTKTRIAMTHYPPIGLDLSSSLTSQLLERYGVTLCVFGHLHNVRKGACLFGKRGPIEYKLTSCDYLDFKPLKIL